MDKKLLLVLFCILWVVPVFAQSFEADPDSIPFAPAGIYSGGHGLVSVFCADLDWDNDIDLVIVDHPGPGLFVMWNNGGGTFQGPDYMGTGADPTSVFCPDLYEDGYLDLVVTCQNCSCV